MPSYRQRHWREIAYLEQQEWEKRQEEKRAFAEAQQPLNIRFMTPLAPEPIAPDPSQPLAEPGHWCKCEGRWLYGPRNHRHCNGLHGF